MSWLPDLTQEIKETTTQIKIMNDLLRENNALLMKIKEILQKQNDTRSQNHRN